ncbi:hypothetical protein PY650_31350 [Rhizobium calliandrae]|uniref:Uncharacterized protein n=1 Tax=Rhizobium calliandrae TaxID=1312182 RepID=A0ABT7KN34_9HYPH|nr:hypothetical protein [Rhizobium calliandrae]MDL2410035.1 hypothetical protein [Rhizobium calliandrae]
MSRSAIVRPERVTPASSIAQHGPWDAGLDYEHGFARVISDLVSGKAPEIDANGLAVSRYRPSATVKSSQIPVPSKFL